MVTPRVTVRAAPRSIAAARIDPPLHYLSYRPRTGRYHLLAIWGHTSTGEGHGGGGGGGSHASPVQCVYTVLDGLTGNEVERLRPLTRARAEGLFTELRNRVQAMNARDAKP